MPTTVAGLFLLVALALPGYVHLRVRARALPERTYTTFNEVLSIIFAGFVLDCLVFAVLATVIKKFDLSAPDTQKLIKTPNAYIAEHLSLVTSWFAMAMILVVLLAYLAGSLPQSRLVPVRLRGRLQARARRHEPQQSAWWLLFHEHPGAEIYLGCLLEDGSYLAGTLFSYSRSAIENDQREVTLHGEILYRAPGEDQAAPLPDVNAVVVSARKLVTMTVTYLTSAPLPPAPAPVAPHGTADGGENGGGQP